MDYLKDEQYYTDLYDLITIKECIDVIKFCHKIFQEKFNDEAIKGVPKEEKERGFNYILNMQILTIKTSRYSHKEQRIAEMFEKDREKQDFYDNTPAPANITCDTCGKLLVSDMKMLEDYTDKPMRVLFYYPCKTCKTKQAIYNTREEFISKPKLCPKCGVEIKEKHTIKNKGKSKIITWIRTCPSCKFTETEIDDFEKSHAEFEKEQREDKELLSKYREEFCLSDEKGKEYVEMFEAMEVANEVYEEEKQKYDDSVYQTAIQLKRLSIIELEKLLTETLEKERYIKLSLDKPNIGQFVMVPFSAQDADSSRKGQDSTRKLEEVLKAVLGNTNWRLQDNTLSYRLGYVSGQLKGYEQEEDLVAISGKKKKQKQSKIDPEKRTKYNYHNTVQLARIMGKHAGIETIRKRRLEKEPQGFFLEENEGPLTCGLCRETTPGNKIWWTPETLYCADCWRNIQEGVIPPLTWDSDNKVWIQDWQIKSEYSVQPMTRKKLERGGLLHGRQLKRQDGTTYCTVYLVEENKEFMKKYPKKPELDLKLYWSDEHKSLMMDVKKIDYSKNPSGRETMLDEKGRQVKF